MGLDVPEEHFYTSALATAAFLKEQAAGCSAFVIGEAGLLNALYDVGITMNDVNPDYVVVGEGRSYSLDTLTKATNLVLKGAKLIGANSDVSGPIENGIAPACRALIAPIEMATGTQAYFCGKPNPLMMRTGLNMLGCHSAEAVMVGDRMDTDVISGMESGMSTVLVLSGCSTKDTLKTYSYGYRCDFRNGKWYVYCIGSLWMFNEGYTQNLCLSSDNGIEWSGRYRQYGKSKRGIAGLIAILDREAKKNTDHAYVIYQRKTYGNIPMWVIMKTLTFGQMSKMYSFLTTSMKTKISIHFEHVSEKEFIN